MVKAFRITWLRSMTGIAGSCTGAEIPLLLRQWKMENERFLMPEMPSTRYNGRPKALKDNFMY